VETASVIKVITENQLEHKISKRKEINTMLLKVTKNIKLNTISDVKEFTTAAMQQKFNTDLVSGRFLVDAKSIMGCFSLDLSKAIELVIHNDDGSDLDDEAVANFIKAIDKFIVK